MNRTHHFFLIIFLLFIVKSYSAPSVVTPFIKIDQFGYFCASQKVAVIVDPQTGFNASQSYNPGIGNMQYQVRRWEDDKVIFSGTLISWNKGKAQDQSGDRGWWFDFSSVVTPGSYYIFDLGTNVGSYKFEIGSEVYDQVLKQACRTFFYQRSNFSKQIPFANPKWTDGAAFERPNQDRFARNRWTKLDPTSSRDVSGGWFDAGDLNKYVTNAVEPVSQMLEAYRRHPTIFKDDYDIPESGNGVPDILDEAKWELDWLIKMQDATGTNGLCLKVGSDNYSLYVPPSTDINNRYYLPECTSATLSGAAIFAMAANVYKSLGNQAMTQFSGQLKMRAVAAWNRAKTSTTNFSVFQIGCDDQDIKSGSADQSESWQKQCALTAAVYLFELTGDAEYQAYVNANYNKVEPVGTGWWGPYRLFVQKALFKYCELLDKGSVIKRNIQLSKLNTQTGTGLEAAAGETDLYRAYMLDGHYTWGSNMTRSACGNIALDFAEYEIQPTLRREHFSLAEQYLHWLHGVNPMSIVMLSNMYEFGGDSCVNEIFHSWFSDGTIYDNAKLSERGPVPGFLVGGPNAFFSVASISPPSNQPIQKMFKDWNTGWDGTRQQSSFEISEPAIYYQAMYIELLSSLIASQEPNCGNQILSTSSVQLKGKVETENTAVLEWKTSPRYAIKLQKKEGISEYSLIAEFKADTGALSREFKDPVKLLYVTSYRLAFSDLSGTTNYSNVLQLKPSLQEELVQMRVNSTLKSIGVTSKKSMAARFEILSIDGRLLKEGAIRLAPFSYANINLKEISPGQYICRISSNGFTKTLLFVL